MARPLKYLLGKTREQIKEILGEPDAISIGTRKYKYPLVYKYGDIEYHFTTPQDGVVVTIFDEKHHRTLEKM